MSLRGRVLRSGAQLALRQLVGFAIGFAGVVSLSRILGAELYGTFVTILGIQTYLYMVSQWGIGVCLVRKENILEMDFCHQAFSLLVAMGFTASLFAIMFLPFVERWVNIDRFGVFAIAMFFSLPVQTAAVAPLARLEREFNFGRIALAELSGQVAMYLVALPLAFAGLGVWAPVFGWWAQQLLLLLVIFRISKYRPRFIWRKSMAGEILRYGFSFSLSTWIWQSRTLINPLIVSHFVGTAAVAYVALAVKFVEALTFARVASWRLSISTLSGLQSDRRRFAQAVSEGMQFQVLSVGPLLVLFALSGSYLMNKVYEPHWLSVMEIYPFIALAYLAGSLFNMHSSALYVLGHGWEVTVFQVLRVGLFSLAAIVLIPLFGIRGYAWGEVFAIPSYVIVHWFLVKRIQSIDYRVVVPWAIAIGAALFYSMLGPVVFLPGVIVCIWPESWKAITRILSDLRFALNW